MLHEIHTISSFEIVAPYTLRIHFDDDSVKVINFVPMLRGELYGPLRNPDFFNRARLDLEAGTLIWPNEADFDPATLHDWDKVGEAMIAMAGSWPELQHHDGSPTIQTDIYEKVLFTDIL